MVIIVILLVIGIIATDTNSNSTSILENYQTSLGSFLVPSRFIEQFPDHPNP